MSIPGVVTCWLHMLDFYGMLKRRRKKTKDHANMKLTVVVQQRPTLEEVLRTGLHLLQPLDPISLSLAIAVVSLVVISTSTTICKFSSNAYQILMFSVPLLTLDTVRSL